MALILSVTYDDGTTEDIRIRPAGIIAAERRYQGGLERMEATIYSAWFTKGMPGGPDGFDGWLNSLADASDHAEPSPPLAQAPSPEG